MREQQKLKTARNLRKELTEAEKQLWYFLRDRRLDGIKFRRQCPIWPYICDFASTEKKLVIEVAGGQHATQAAYDLKRDSFLRKQDFTVLRFWNNDVLYATNAVLEMILSACHVKKIPHSNPLPQAGERIGAVGAVPAIDLVANATY